ncbi:CMRF35-like molecule 7 [Molossus molossus]|uniref:Ig-like domain-containing protein n=1 Tax=Molossus molossus TaxID=27622 RepID=A0A7J8CWV9_MOLMO|nr:CMRF35-like molecule 7 [Molossus molossus]KAF6415252.1 hypothetical protein HJG59_002446 [Molossus molossus]
MWLPSALLLLSLAGCFSIQGPKMVRGQEGSSVTVQCRYEPGWETNKKWWCRGAYRRSCRILLQTTGSQQTVRKDRVAITDNQNDRVITITMKDLRQDDQDTYWCGINRIGTDRGAPITVTIGPENLLSGTTANTYPGVSSSSHRRNHYMLLVFVKVPILLALVGAILWLKWSPRVPMQPAYMDLSFDLTEDTAP